MPRAVLAEVEEVLTSTEGSGARRYCLDLLDGIDAELLEWPKHHPVPRHALRVVLDDLMGPATRHAWSGLGDREAGPAGGGTEGSV